MSLKELFVSPGLLVLPVFGVLEFAKLLLLALKQVCDVLLD